MLQMQVKKKAIKFILISKKHIFKIGVAGKVSSKKVYNMYFFNLGFPQTLLGHMMQNNVYN